MSSSPDSKFQKYSDLGACTSHTMNTTKHKCDASYLTCIHYMYIQKNWCTLKTLQSSSRHLMLYEQVHQPAEGTMWEALSNEWYNTGKGPCDKVDIYYSETSSSASTSCRK